MSSAPLSFGFKAKTQDKIKLVNQPDPQECDGREDGAQRVLSLAKGSDFVVNPKDRKESKEKAPLVIACTGNTLQKQEVKDDLTLQAERELLEGRSQEEVEEEQADAPGPTIQIQADRQNGQVDEKRFRVSKIDDYDSIPVDGFGMGMLRGMGYKEGEGIGGFKKASVKCLEPVLRPKGLGLGASRPKEAQKQAAAVPGEEEEKLELKKGAYVRFSKSGNDSYGQVEGLDLDSARVFIKLAVGNDAVKSVSENSVVVVTKKEYKKYSKVINRDMYDKYKIKQEEREEQWKKEEGSRKRRSRTPDKGESKKSKKESKSSSKSSSSSSQSFKWVQPNLRVRFIDEKYKNGRYFMSKLVISDVPSLSSVTLRADNGSVLEDISPKYLETLVPRESDALVMILRGEAKGELAEIVDRNKSKCRVVVQTVPDRDQVLRLDFDDICQYVGEIPS